MTSLRIFAGVSLAVLLGVVGVQYLWFRQALSIEDKDFDQRITTALRTVSERLLAFNRNPNNRLLAPVERPSPDFYTVFIGDVIDQSTLEAFLRQEFLRQDVKLNFEYAVFDCMQNRLEYGNFVCYTSDNCLNGKPFVFPYIKKQNYYFAVHFPEKQRFLLSQMNTWFLSSAILLVVLLCLAYALIVIFRQKRLSEIQTGFINNMTHEFKTPLSTIAISGEVLSQPGIVQHPERLQHYARIITHENQRLQRGVDAILKNALLARHPKLNLQKQNAHQLIQSLLDNLAPVFEEKKAKIIVDFQAKNAAILADELHFTNIIHNLIDNGLKYCQTTPVLQITTLNQDKKLIIKVKDNGIGIPKRERRLIFRQFYRVPTGDVHDVKGFGLGLFYVSQMVKAHEGKIHLHSQPGEGSEFDLRFRIFSQNQD
jgi:two-component system, OmpR family, phosphate regulon sensor histidine kinase PhoR